MELKNPKTGEVKKIEGSWAYCLVFGCFYFLAHGMLLHTVISAVLAFCTCGISWLIFPFMAGSLVKDYYKSKGWECIGEINHNRYIDP